MPHSQRVTRSPGSPQHDYRGTSRIPVSNKNILTSAKLLSEQTDSMPDDTILRGAKIDGKKCIYFRNSSTSGTNRYLKNKNEIIENRESIKKILNQIVESFEDKRLGKITKKERAAIEEIQELTSGTKKDITAGDIKGPLKEITKSVDKTPKGDLKTIYQSSARSESTTFNLMLSRFKLMDTIQKNNLKKLLFPDATRISIKKENHIVDQMMALVERRLDHPKSTLQKLVSTADDKEAVKAFVDAWTAFRSSEKKPESASLKLSAQFSWAKMMDQFCDDLKNNIFLEKNIPANATNIASIGSQNLQSTVSSKPELKSRPKAVLNSEAKLRPAQEPKGELPLSATSLQKKTHSTAKKKISLQSKSTNAAPTPKLIAKKSPISPLKITTAMNHVSPVTAFLPIPRTESGVLEDQIVHFEKVATEARVRADLARQRLDALYRVRSKSNNTLGQGARSVASIGNQLSLRNFSEVRMEITSASLSGILTNVSPLRSGLTLEKFFQFGADGVTVSPTPRRLGLSSSESSSQVSDSEADIFSSPTQLKAKAHEQPATPDNS
jgi:hypothetical protein